MSAFFLRRHLDDIKMYVPEFVPEFIPEFVPEFDLNTDLYPGTNSGMNSGMNFFYVVKIAPKEKKCIEKEGTNRKRAKGT